MQRRHAWPAPEQRSGSGSGPRPGVRLRAAIAFVAALLVPAAAGTVLAQQPSGGPPPVEVANVERAMAELRDLVRIALGAPNSWPKLTLPPASAVASAPPSAPKIESRRLVALMLADTEDVWDELFASLKRTYPKPKLVLYTRVTPSGCGVADAQVSGPHYCEVDNHVYLDLTFFDELRATQSVSGDMATYYIIGHEIGHHVQQVLGILPAVGKIERQLARLGDTQGRNALSVKVELQADCMAGLVAYHAHRMKQRLETDDVETGLRTAAALGSDRLQKLEQGVVQPETFTHGASEQRVRWFRRGLDTGALHMCDTFSASDL